MAVWVGVLSVLVKFCSLSRALEIISPHRQLPSHSATESRAKELVTTVDSLLAANFLIFRPVCWKRAAVLHRYLALRGTETKIVFGVRKKGDGVLTGHAWLEAEGKPVFESSPPDYAITYTYPSNERFDIELALLT